MIHLWELQSHIVMAGIMINYRSLNVLCIIVELGVKITYVKKGINGPISLGIFIHPLTRKKIVDDEE